MRRIKAVVYGVGAMNSIATRMMIEKGVDIVGALARSPDKVGKDLGDVAGLGYQTGVIVEDDPDRVLSTREADIAVIAVASYMSDMYEHLRRCAEHGVNAVTISEEALYPWNRRRCRRPSSTSWRAGTASRSRAPAIRTPTG